MTERIARRVTVPDVVGMQFELGRELAVAAGVKLANPDPDGPPIAGLAWRGLYYISQQSPAPGTVVYEWDSVAVYLVKHGDSPEPSRTSPHPRPPMDAAHAQVESDTIIDLD